jgi:dTMP kinase
MKSNPKFITLEGVDGAGKSTCMRFIKKYLTDKKLNYLFTREPGGTSVGEKLRKILLHDEMLPETETLLMFSARNEHVHQIIKPNLNAGLIVISDRFTDATYAYQSGGKNVQLEKITILKNWVHEDLKPDLTLLFNAVSISLKDKTGCFFINCIICHPKRVLKGLEYAPSSCKLKATFSKELTIAPVPNFLSLPPLDFVPVSSEYFLAKALNCSSASNFL